MQDPVSPTRRPFALALGGIGGYVDGVGFVTLFGLFTAHMSGNVWRDDHTLLPESGAFYVLALVVAAMALQTVAVRSVSGIEGAHHVPHRHAVGGGP